MGGADPLGVWLEEGPDQQDAKVIGAEAGDGIEVPTDGIGIPVVPAEPPVMRRRVVDAEAVAERIERGERQRVCGCNSVRDGAARRNGCGGCGGAGYDERSSIQCFCPLDSYASLVGPCKASPVQVG
jgi:hypothetical protein